MDKDNEYGFLRQEIAENKKYVFERPIVTITAGLALFKVVFEIFWPFIPPLIILLLFFNFWFTINRLNSSARIIAYLQLFLEKENKKYIGWENFLREYRKFHKQKTKKEVKKLIAENIDNQAVPDSFRFYDAIRNFHIFFILLLVGVSTLLAFDNDFLQTSEGLSKNIEIYKYVGLIFSTILAISFFIFVSKKGGPEIKRKIEIERTIILEVEKNMK